MWSRLEKIARRMAGYLLALEVSLFPKQHLVVSSVWAAASLPVLGKRTPIAWASSILIDVDHYLWYAVHFRNPSLRDALSYFYTTPTKRRTPSLNVFHTIEFLGLLAAASTLSSALRALLYGFLFHILADTYYDIRVGTLFRRRRSILLSLLRPRARKA